jgi:hypothetical protein
MTTAQEMYKALSSQPEIGAETYRLASRAARHVIAESLMAATMLEVMLQSAEGKDIRTGLIHESGAAFAKTLEEEFRFVVAEILLGEELD